MDSRLHTRTWPAARHTLQCGAAVLMLTLTMLQGCTDADTRIAATDPAQQDSLHRARASTGNSKKAASDPPTHARPGVGLRQGKVDGLSAAYLGTEMLMTSLVTADGSLAMDRFDSAMNAELLDQAVETFASAELPVEPKEQLAFLCNAYNINALSILSMLVAEFGMNLAGSHSPHMEQDPGERFDAQPVRIANATFTMREVREECILRLGDPRALACLISVDRFKNQLPRAALWPKRIDDQLDDSCAQWVNSGELASVEGSLVHLDPAIDRLASHFTGEPFGDVHGFLKRYADPTSDIGIALMNGPADDIRGQ